MKSRIKNCSILTLVLTLVGLFGFIVVTEAREYDPVCYDRFHLPVYTAIFSAIELEGDIKTAKQLIENANEDDINCVTKAGNRTLLHNVSREGWGADIAELLLIKGANIHALDFQGNTPLHSAAKNGQLEMVEFLISAGADVNLTDFRGRTAMFWASYAGHTEIVELLIANGANINTQDDQGATPLTQASNEGFTDIVDLLILAGANVNVATTDGDVALD